MVFFPAQKERHGTTSSNASFRAPVRARPDMKNTSSKKNPSILGEEALERAVQHNLVSLRAGKEITLTFKAVPALIPQWVTMAVDAVSGAGATLTKPQIDVFRRKLVSQMDEAFRYSQHSTVRVHCHIHGAGCDFQVEWIPVSVTSTYDKLLETRAGTLFGEYPDAMVTAVAGTLGSPAEAPILDLGAGVGRNAIALARIGHPVVAIEPASSFAAQIFEKSMAERVAIRVIQKNALDPSLDLPNDHFSMAVVSEVIPETRDAGEAARILRRAVASLRSGGTLVFNTFVGTASLGSNAMIRQASVAAASSFLTEAEITALIADLGVEPVRRLRALEFEHENLPPEGWPPTGWFEDWCRGFHIFRLPKDTLSPIELEWFVWKKR